MRDLLSFVFTAKQYAVSLKNSCVQNTSASLKDVGVVLSIGLVFGVLRFVVIGACHPTLRQFPSVFKVMFRKVIRPKKDSKFCENLGYVMWHLTSFLLLLYTLCQEGLSSDEAGWTRLMIRDFPSHIWYWTTTPAESVIYQVAGWPEIPISTAVKRLYLIELAFWSSCLMFLFIETIREDFYAMLAHHVATCCLIVLSYLASFYRIGLIVLLLHDVGDIFLYSTKTLHYSVAPRLPVDVLFVGFVLVYFVSRLLLYPILCVWPSIDFGKLTGRDISWYYQEMPYGFVFPLLLVFLQLLHVFWFSLILRMVFRFFKERTVTNSGDIRSDDESGEVSNSCQNETYTKQKKLNRIYTSDLTTAI